MAFQGSSQLNTVAAPLKTLIYSPMSSQGGRNRSHEETYAYVKEAKTY